MLDKNSSTPLYIQLDDILRLHISNGDWKPQQLIPSENQLCKMYGISRMTVRSVITSLVNEGLLYRVQGKGTFVSAPKISAKSPAYVGIREQLEKQGFLIDTKLIELQVMPAGKNVGQILNIEASLEVYHIRRVRYADGKPVSIHESYIPRQFCESLCENDIEQEQLCHVLDEKYHLTAKKVHETLESVSASASEAKLLNISRGHPLLLLKEINYTATGQTFEYTKIVFRGDMIKIEFDYQL